MDRESSSAARICRSLKAAVACSENGSSLSASIQRSTAIVKASHEGHATSPRNPAWTGGRCAVRHVRNGDGAVGFLTHTNQFSAGQLTGAG